tara:strand:+ start:1542 stop:1949 length:408 start_codon:yes stop_codon:yes gene_type:complete
MELVYFISGIITVGAVYSAVYLRSVKSKYADLLASLQSSSNISSIRNAENLDKLEELNQYIREVKQKLTEDSYEGITGLEKNIKDNNTTFVTAQQRTNKFINTTEGEIRKLYGEIQNTQAMIRALKEDPNFNNRY